MGREMEGRFKRERGSRGSRGSSVYLWLILLDVQQKTIKFCKAIILQLKNKVAKKRRTKKKKQRHHFPEKGPNSQSYSFSSSHVWIWELDHREIWEPNNWCFWTVVLEKTLESPLDYKEIKLLNPKGNQSWIFIGRTDAETPILWLPNAKNWLIGKDPVAGKDW